MLLILLITIIISISISISISIIIIIIRGLRVYGVGLRLVCRCTARNLLAEARHARIPQIPQGAAPERGRPSSNFVDALAPNYSLE